jgi:hypothetical protein
MTNELKRLDTSFGSCEPPESYPLPCFNLITLITYLFSFYSSLVFIVLLALVLACARWLINTRYKMMYAVCN